MTGEHDAGHRLGPADLDAIGGAATFLSRVLLAPPDEALLEQLTADAGMAGEWPIDDDASASAMTRLVAAADEARRKPEALEDVEQDHRQLFVGPGILGACPYESVYRSEDRLVFEAATMQVREAYAEFGVQAPRLNREPDDHLGLECSFVAHVCGVGLDAWEGADHATYGRAVDALERFSRAHLQVWVPEFLSQLRANARTDFYRSVAELTDGWLRRLAS